MIKVNFTTEDIEALRYWRFHHSHWQVRLKMEAIYLKTQAISNEQIMSLCGISKTTFYRYLREYKEGGMDRLSEVKIRCQQTKLMEHRATIECYFRDNPPATIAEACAKIEELSGLRRCPSQVREFLKSIGMKALRVGQIPAKADVEEQEEFKKQKLIPRLEEAKSGKRKVFFMDASLFVFAPFLGIVWCFQRLFIKAPGGRHRLSVLGALDAMSKEVFTVNGLSYITAQVVCELLRMLAGAYPGMALTIILDNARYQRCALVQSVAGELGIELLYLPAYSPNLNLIERLWKFVKKKCLYSKYYRDKESFEQAIMGCIEGTSSKYKEELERLLTLKFQTFKEVLVLGEGAKISLFPVSKQAHKKVSSKAA